MAKKRRDESDEPKPPAWLERHGEWLTWWDLDQAGVDDDENPPAWTIHLVQSNETERHVWLCQNNDEYSAARFTVEELSLLISHLQAAMNLALNPPEAAFKEDSR